MIHLFIGTKAQFIKMAPIMAELRERGLAYRYVDSGQHAEITRSLRRVFGTGEPDVCLRSANEDIVSKLQALRWTAELMTACWTRRHWLRTEVFPGGGICLIHGDTLSTLIGLHMARAAGLKVAHVEAGLRSYRVLDPFPEELVRIWCMRFADLLFAPSAQAVENIRKMRLRGRLVDAGGNTVVDALRLMEGATTTVDVPDRPFALATCHRLETLTQRSRLKRVVDLMNHVSSTWPVLFVVHKPTRRALEEFDLLERLGEKVRLLEMQDYVNFTALLRAARVVLTDGGSIQEECAYLNKPCLILRHSTERPDGLGTNAVLWNYDPEQLARFQQLCRSVRELPPRAWPRPSRRIVDALVEMGCAQSSAPAPGGRPALGAGFSETA